MGAGDGINEGKTKTVTVGIAPFHAALEEMLEDFRIESRAVVLEDNLRGFLITLQCNGDRAGGWQVF